VLCGIDLYDAEGDGFAVSSRPIDDNLHHPRADALPLERAVQINLLEEYCFLDWRRLQPSGVLLNDRDNADFIDIPLLRKSLDLLSFTPAKQLVGDPAHRLMLDTAAECQIRRLRRAQCDRRRDG
jgi:hypothetical protein